MLLPYLGAFTLHGAANKDAVFFQIQDFTSRMKVPL